MYEHINLTQIFTEVDKSITEFSKETGIVVELFPKDFIKSFATYFFVAGAEFSIDGKISAIQELEEIFNDEIV